MTHSPLPPECLYRACDSAALGFETTDALQDLGEVLGQEPAVEAVRFGVGMQGEGPGVRESAYHGSDLGGRCSADKQMFSIRSHLCYALSRVATRHSILRCFWNLPQYDRRGGAGAMKHIESEATRHAVREGDARDLSFVPSESIHLVCTSPPYGSLKTYPHHPDQLGNMPSYEAFLKELDEIWTECLRILVPGGRIACVVGDVCVSRRVGKRHHVLPLSADLQVRCREVGFDCLTPIRWLKVANIRLEASRSSRYLGKPNLPNGIIKNDIEHILFFRKPGYRKPTREMEERSFIASEDYKKWFAPVWADVTGQVRKDHPAPYPVEIPRRLIRMFSFAGDTVLDPFAGTGTTALAAQQCGRHSISIDIEPTYIKLIESRLSKSKLNARVIVSRKSKRWVPKQPTTLAITRTEHAIQNVD